MAYTNIDDPSKYFQTTTFSSSGSAAAVTNGGNSNLQPDWVWSKGRSMGNSSHDIWDSSRGVNSTLFTSANEAEDTSSNRIVSFNSDGFNYGTSGNHQTSGDYVAWQWKANGGTTSSNSDGSITSTVQANTTAGFSIITYTGNGSASTIGHGLGVVPAMIIVKCRNEATNWTVYHKNSNATPQNYILELNNTNAAADNDRFNDTAPTSSVFSVNAGSSTVNKSSNTYVAYCFNSVQGYSEFGKYRGTGNANGTFVYTGFKPAFVMIKSLSSASWSLYDNKRLGYNPIDVWLRANGNDAESTSAISGDDIDLYSNGFKLRNSDNTINGYNTTYVYMAFAEHPFVTSKGAPTTAR